MGRTGHPLSIMGLYPDIVTLAGMANGLPAALLGKSRLASRSGPGSHGSTLVAQLAHGSCLGDLAYYERGGLSEEVRSKSAILLSSYSLLFRPSKGFLFAGLGMMIGLRQRQSVKDC